VEDFIVVLTHYNTDFISVRLAHVCDDTLSLPLLIKLGKSDTRWYSFALDRQMFSEMQYRFTLAYHQSANSENSMHIHTDSTLTFVAKCPLSSAFSFGLGIHENKLVENGCGNCSIFIAVYP
jgi:hypothetical protein